MIERSKEENLNCKNDVWRGGTSEVGGRERERDREREGEREKIEREKIEREKIER